MAKETGKKADTGPAVRIRALSKDGFRRCGRFFSAEGTVIQISELSEEEKEILSKEPRLAIQVVDSAEA